jgi:glutamate synthase domain-containing protein 2
LYKSNFNQQVSLIGAGKVRTPGDILKLLALGADAVYIGSIALFAMSHTQVLKSLPFEPPNQIIWYEGKQADKFNMEEGAMALKRFLEACREELAIGIRALGKLNIAEVSKDDLVSLSQTISKGCNIPTAYHSCYQTDLHLKKLKIKRI